MHTSSPLSSLSRYKTNPPRTLNETTSDLFTNNSNGVKSATFSSPIGRENFLVRSPRSPGALSRSYSLSDVGMKPSLIKRLNDSRSPYGSDYSNLTSTQIDTKSPGYTSRIVRYNEEQERLATHQSKYNSPGVFPIVHFFKKNLPILKQKSNSATVRISSPDLSRHNTPEHNRMLLEKIVSSPAHSGQSAAAETSTRSVLDALKEISRKRIRASEECDVDDGKRLRLDCNNQSESRKRLRDESHIDGSVSPNNQLYKRYRSLDELIASQSSSEGGDDLGIQLKKTIPQVTVVHAKKPKRVVSVSVETQTTPPEVTTTATEPEPSASNQPKLATPVNTVDHPHPPQPTKRSPPPPVIFDERPLEVMRKNRLSILMGTFAQPELSQPSAEKSTTIIPEDVTDDAKPADKPLVSILSAPNKTPQKNKHVTFNIPSSSENSSDSAAAVVAEPTRIVSTVIDSGVTQTSAAIVTPIISSTVKESSPVLKSHLEVPPTPSSSPVTSEPPSTLNTSGITFSSSFQYNFANYAGDSQPPPAQMLFKQDSPSVKTLPGVTSPTLTPATTNNKTVDSAATTVATNSFIFMSPTKAQSSSLPQISSTSSPSQMKFAFTGGTATSPKVGGFKFDLTKPISTTSTATVPSTSDKPFSFGPSNNTAPVSKPFAFNSTSSAAAAAAATPSQSAFTSTANAPIFSFGDGTKPAATSTTPTFKFDLASNPAVTTTAVVPLSTSSASSLPSFPVNSTTSTNPFGATTNLFNTTATVDKNQLATTSSSAFTPGFSLTNTPSFGPTASLDSVNNKTPTFQFNNTIPTTTAFFGVPTAPISSFGTTPTLNFGGTISSTTTTTTPSFGTTTSTATFPVTNFGSTTTSTTGFGTTTLTPTFGVTTTVPSFGTTTTTGPSFGTTTTAPAFATTAIPIFGTTTAPSFGVATTASPSFATTPFNSNTKVTFASTSTAASFGNNAFSPAVTSAPSFGTNFINSSGTPSISSMFQNSNASAAPSSNSTGFGNVTTSVATTTTPSIFGGNITFGKQLFGTGTPMPFSNTATSSVPPTFGSTMSSFAPPNAFVVTTTAANTFGGTTQSAFGIAATTATPGFGSNVNNANSFGTVTTTTASGFGTTTGFGNATPAPSFGGTNANAFGGNTGFTANAFGASSTAFDAPKTTAPAFGSTNTPSFGSGFSAGSTFGNTGTPAAFGATGTTPALNSTSGFNAPSSSFGANFTAPNFAKPTDNSFAAPNSFGAFDGNNFGTGAVPKQQGGVFKFGPAAVPNKPGIFSFGSNESPKPTFNFSGSGGGGGGTNNTSGFGTAAGMNFGGSPAPSFGAVQTPQFNNSQPGMFSIGSGSAPPGRNRTQLKAKRRT